MWEYRQLILIVPFLMAALILVMNFLEAGPGFLLGPAAVIGAGAYVGAAIVFLVATRRG